jgi:transcription elongation factor Elf1
MDAVHKVPALPSSGERSPRRSDYFDCPNCGTTFEQYKENMRFLKCQLCGLELPATIHQELVALRARHEKRNE